MRMQNFKKGLKKTGLPDHRCLPGGAGRWLAGLLFLGFLGASLLPVPLLAQPAGERTPPQVILRVDGLSCPFCAYGLEKKLLRLEGVEGVEIRINEGQVILTLAPGASVSRQAVEQAVAKAGFTAREIQFSKTGSP